MPLPSSTLLPRLVQEGQPPLGPGGATLGTRLESRLGVEPV
jgi:hypothetical protein